MAPKILIFPPSFKTSFGIIFLLWPGPARYSQCDFTNNMASREPVGSIDWHSDSGSGNAEVPKFIWCTDGWEPQIREVWGFGEYDVTREVHLTVRVDVGTGVIGEFSPDYFTETWLRVPMFGRISINRSAELFGVPDFHRTGGPFWDDNLLVVRSSWGDGGTTTHQNWGSKPGGPYGSVAVPWNCPVHVLPVNIRRISENTSAAARRVCDNRLWSNCLARMRIPSTSRNPIHNRRFNQQGDDWDGPGDQSFLLKNSVGSVNISDFYFISVASVSSYW